MVNKNLTQDEVDLLETSRELTKQGIALPEQRALLRARGDGTALILASGIVSNAKGGDDLLERARRAVSVAFRAEREVCEALRKLSVVPPSKVSDSPPPAGPEGLVEFLEKGHGDALIHLFSEGHLRFVPEGHIPPFAPYRADILSSRTVRQLLRTLETGVALRRYEFLAIAERLGRLWMPRGKFLSETRGRRSKTTVGEENALLRFGTDLSFFRSLVRQIDRFVPADRTTETEIASFLRRPVPRGDKDLSVGFQLRSRIMAAQANERRWARVAVSWTRGGTPRGGAEQKAFHAWCREVHGAAVVHDDPEKFVTRVEKYLDRVRKRAIT